MKAEPLVLTVRHQNGSGREQARLALRSALIARLAAGLGVASARLAVQSAPGSAPRMLLDGALLAGSLSISHADALSVAVHSATNKVGVDLMLVEELEDWAPVARDYLGTGVAAALAATAPAERMRAFAQAWTAREAQLKCLGLPLAEWSATPPACHLVQLDLAPGHVATLAWC